MGVGDRGVGKAAVSGGPFALGVSHLESTREAATDGVRSKVWGGPGPQQRH